MLLTGWLALVVIAVIIAPPWASVVIDGEFGFLPADSDSKQAEVLFREAFPHESLASNIMLVAHRVTAGGISDADKDFIADVLKPGLETVLADYSPEDAEQPLPADDEAGLRDKRIVEKITCHTDGPIGELFNSRDKHATLVEVELSTDFTDGRNDAVIEAVEAYLAGIPGQETSKIGRPTGLQLDITGSATVGRDMRRAARQSAKATELWTVLLVMFLLVAIYRAPLLAIIPLFTVAIATTVSLRLLAWFSGFHLVKLFAGIETYVTVLIYGAGVDYCLFLIARYKEELDAGRDAGRGNLQYAFQGRCCSDRQRLHGDVRHRNADLRAVWQVPAGGNRDYVWLVCRLVRIADIYTDAAATRGAMGILAEQSISTCQVGSWLAVANERGVAAARL